LLDLKYHKEIIPIPLWKTRRRGIPKAVTIYRIVGPKYNQRLGSWIKSTVATINIL